MTELVDEITIKITLHHCRDKLEIKPLRDWLSLYIGRVVLPALNPGAAGIEWFNDDKVSVRWSHTGLHEIPEEGGGDN